MVTIFIFNSYFFINMADLWFRPFVWLDYRLAFLFAVIIPLVLLVWSLIEESQAAQRLLIIYWRVASLLMITVYLMIPAWGISFITSIVARLLIPISLWFWVDLNDDIKDLSDRPFKWVLTSWRWAISLYCVIGAIAIFPFASCAISETNLATPFCKVWFEAPWLYQQIFHSNSKPGFLGFLGMIGLFFYVLYFASFLLLRLPKQGRSAIDN
jgi:hypothetical protein